jgi:hypothetical protein
MAAMAAARGDDNTTTMSTQRGGRDPPSGHSNTYYPRDSLKQLPAEVRRPEAPIQIAEASHLRLSRGGRLALLLKLAPGGTRCVSRRSVCLRAAPASLPSRPSRPLAFSSDAQRRPLYSYASRQLPPHK